MAFAVITFAPKLTAAERELAKAGAPAFTETSEAYPELLDGSGWEIDDQTDVTAAFFDLCRRELTAFEARSDRLRELLGKSDFNERLTLRLSKVAGIEAGVIRREIYKVHPVSDPSGRDPQHKS